jgi:hypothetical protein
VALSAQLRFEANAKASFALRLLIKFDIGAMVGRLLPSNKMPRDAPPLLLEGDYYSSANLYLWATRGTNFVQTYPIARLELD